MPNDRLTENSEIYLVHARFPLCVLTVTLTLIVSITLLNWSTVNPHPLHPANASLESAHWTLLTRSRSKALEPRLKADYKHTSLSSPELA